MRISQFNEMGLRPNGKVGPYIIPYPTHPSHHNPTPTPPPSPLPYQSAAEDGQTLPYPPPPPTLTKCSQGWLNPPHHYPTLPNMALVESQLRDFHSPHSFPLSEIGALLFRGVVGTGISGSLTVTFTTSTVGSSVRVRRRTEVDACIFL